MPSGLMAKQRGLDWSRVHESLEAGCALDSINEVGENADILRPELAGRCVPKRRRIEGKVASQLTDRFRSLHGRIGELPYEIQMRA